MAFLFVVYAFRWRIAACQLFAILECQRPLTQSCSAHISPGWLGGRIPSWCRGPRFYSTQVHGWKKETEHPMQHLKTLLSLGAHVTFPGQTWWSFLPAFQNLQNIQVEQKKMDAMAQDSPWCVLSMVASGAIAPSCISSWTGPPGTWGWQ